MPYKSKIYKPVFSSLNDENAYLRAKIEFLLSHSEYLARGLTLDPRSQSTVELKELRDIKNSRSWRITRPLREASRLIQLAIRRLGK